MSEYMEEEITWDIIEYVIQLNFTTHKKKKTRKVILSVLHNMMVKNKVYEFKKIEICRIKFNSWFLFRF